METNIKLKICAGWTSSQEITKRLLDQYNTSDIDLSNIEFVYDNTYDKIVFFNYVTEEVKEGTKSCVLFQEPTWSGSHQKNFSKTKNITVFGYEKHFYLCDDFVETPPMFLYGGRGPWCEGWDFWTYKNLTSSGFKKTKNISSVVSNMGLYENSFKEGCLYKERCNLINHLKSKVDFVDFYGWDCKTSNCKGQIKEKKDGVLNYRFSLCIENANEKNYLTEKFLDCVLTDTIPIYYGCSNVGDLFDKRGFFHIEDINNLEEIQNLLDYINKNSEKLYQDMLPYLQINKNKIFKEFNLLKKIVDFVL